MEKVQSDITVLDKLVALNLVISLWSARRKMLPEDFGGIELPPEDLATLGSKRIADPEKLKIFSTLKSRAFNFLDRHGVRFMSGWAIPEEKADSIVEELSRIRDLFFQAKQDFLQEYESSLDNWISRHSDWSEIIRRSIVSADYVRSRMDFRWQLFKVSPLIESPNSSAVVESGLAEEVTSLANTLFLDVAHFADDIWKKVYMGRREITHKALSPLRTLQQKLAGLSFIEPHVAPIAEIIQTSLDKMPEKGNISGPDLFMLQGLVCLLRDSDNLLIHSQKLIEGQKAENILAELVGETIQYEATAEEEPEEMPDIEIAYPAKPVLPNMGLW